MYSTAPILARTLQRVLETHVGVTEEFITPELINRAMERVRNVSNVEVISLPVPDFPGLTVASWPGRGPSDDDVCLSFNGYLLACAKVNGMYQCEDNWNNRWTRIKDRYKMIQKVKGRTRL